MPRISPSTHGLLNSLLQHAGASLSLADGCTSTCRRTISGGRVGFLRELLAPARGKDPGRRIRLQTAFRNSKGSPRLAGFAHLTSLTLMPRCSFTLTVVFRFSSLSKVGERSALLNAPQFTKLRAYKQNQYPDAAPDEWLFPSKRNRPMDAGWFMAKVIKPVAKKLGFGAIHWHVLRHWNNSAMLKSVIDPAVRMKRVGHATVRTNLIYSHPDLALQKAASDAIWQRLERVSQEMEKRK